MGREVGRQVGREGGRKREEIGVEEEGGREWGKGNNLRCNKKSCWVKSKYQRECNPKLSNPSQMLLHIEYTTVLGNHISTQRKKTMHLGVSYVHTSNKRHTYWHRQGWEWSPCSDGSQYHKTCACSTLLSLAASTLSTDTALHQSVYQQCDSLWNTKK